MYHHVSTTPPARRVRSPAQQHSPRILIRNPPRMNLCFFTHGIREALAPVYGDIEIEVAPKGPQRTASFEDTMNEYVLSVLQAREELAAGLSVILQPGMAKVSRNENESSLMPMYVCSVIVPKRLIGHALDTFMPELDAAESDQLLDLGIAAARMQLPVSGSTHELMMAESLMESINAGLITGYELIDTPPFSPYRNGN